LLKRNYFIYLWLLASAQLSKKWCLCSTQGVWSPTPFPTPFLCLWRRRNFGDKWGHQCLQYWHSFIHFWHTTM